MHPRKARGSISHGLFIQRKWIMQHVAPDHRRHYLAAINPVTVNFAARRPSRMKRRSYFICTHNSNCGRKQRIQSALKFAGGKGRQCFEASYLPQRMNTRVGAPSPIKLDAFLSQAPQNICDLALNGGLVALNLPSVKIRSVIRNGQLEVAHEELAGG